MKLKHAISWLIIILFLLTVSFYVLINFNDAEKYKHKFIQNYDDMIQRIDNLYDYHLHIPNFLSFINNLNATPSTLFGNSFIRTSSILKEFTSEADFAMNKNEIWKHILTSPCDAFFNVSNGKIINLLIIFQSYEKFYPENKNFFKYLYYFSLPYNGISVPALTTMPKLNVDLSSASKREFKSFENKNLLPTLIAKKNLHDFFLAIGITFPFKSITGYNSISFIQFEFGHDYLKIRIQSEKAILTETDSYFDMKIDSSVFLRINSHHSFFKKADSVAGFSVLNSLKKSTYSKSIILRHNNKFFAFGGISDPESFNSCFRYFNTKKTTENTELVILTEKDFNFLPNTKNSIVLMHNNIHYLFADSSSIDEAINLLKSNLQPYTTLVQELFNANTIWGIFMKENLYEIQNDTNSSKFIRTITLQTEKKNNLFVNIQIKKSNPETPDWQFLCEGKIVAGPFEFINHNTNSRECILQDEFNKIYVLSNNDGNKMISFKVDSKIDDKLFMVDMFKNKKYQMLFKSGNQIHLIDRNGKYINAYPFKIHSKITTPLNVIYYPQTNEYRIWFGCKNKKIYSYNLFTLVPEKFQPYAMEHISNLPVHYITYRNSDYLFTIDEQGYVHAFGRKGDPRIGFKNNAIKNLTDYIVNPKSKFDEGYIMYFDHSENSIHKIYFTDNKVITKLPISNDEKIIDFKLTMATNGELGILTSSYFYLFDHNGNEIFRIKNIISADAFKIQHINGSYFVLLFNKKKNEFQLYQNNICILNLKNIENGVVFLAENEKDFLFIGTSGSKVVCYKFKNEHEN